MKNTKNVRRKKWKRKDFELSVIALPTFVWYLAFSYLPMFGVVIAFKEYKRVIPKGSFLKNLIASEWVGFKNFQFIFKSNDFFILLRNTLGYNLIFIVLGTAIPVAMAIAMSMMYSSRKAKVYQTMLFFPHFMSWVVVGYFTHSFLSYDRGLLNSIITFFGGEPIQWYMEKDYWPFILVFVALWKSVGYGMVVYLASITGIDQTLYEAAVVDGANKKQQIKYITLPCLKKVIVMMLILRVGGIFCSDFGLFYHISKGAQGSIFSTTATIDTYIYNALAGSPIGMTSAVSVLQSVTACVTILAANWIVSKIDEESAII